jgi:RNA polymerase sigma-70 factor (ECF subfamily)
MTDQVTEQQQSTVQQPSYNLKKEILELLPALRAFARSLTSNRAEADDLVQETIVKAWGNFDKFVPGSNMRAWLFTILRNTYYSTVRKRRHEVVDATGAWAARVATRPRQESLIAWQDLQSMLALLPDEQREALILVGAAGLSYEEAAKVCGCALGTIKSRVNRGRARLLSLMKLDDSSDLCVEDRVMLAAVR